MELYKEFHAKGLEIVGLFFENDATLSVARPRVLAFIKRYGVEFPILVPGTNDDAEVAAKLPQLVNFAVYPTTSSRPRRPRPQRARGFRECGDRAPNTSASCVTNARSSCSFWRKKPHDRAPLRRQDGLVVGRMLDAVDDRDVDRCRRNWLAWHNRVSGPLDSMTGKVFHNIRGELSK